MLSLKKEKKKKDNNNVSGLGVIIFFFLIIIFLAKTIELASFNHKKREKKQIRPTGFEPVT